MASKMIIIGLDIGGANIKAVKALYREGKLYVDDVVREYMPIWIRGIEGLRAKLFEIKQRFRVEGLRYFVGICMTAELSDVFQHKGEGVLSIVKLVEEVFYDATRRLYVNVDMDLVEVEHVHGNPLTVAAANWAASARLLEYIARETGIRNAVFIDIGSTTTTIIPVVDGKPMVRGKADPEKLAYGELVYVGALRTDVASLVSRVPLRGLYVGVCRERFALMADVHLVLGYINPEDYAIDTANGRGKSVEEALARLSRVVCADRYMVGVAEIREIARYIYEVQVFKVFEALLQIRSWLASLGLNPDDFTVFVAGIGKHVATEAAKRAGFARLADIDGVLGKPLAPVIPAYAAALMVAEELAGEKNASSS